MNAWMCAPRSTYRDLALADFFHQINQKIRNIRNLIRICCGINLMFASAINSSGMVIIDCCSSTCSFLCTVRAHATWDLLLLTPRMLCSSALSGTLDSVECGVCLSGFSSVHHCFTQIMLVTSDGPAMHVVIQRVASLSFSGRTTAIAMRLVDGVIRSRSASRTVIFLFHMNVKGTTLFLTAVPGPLHSWDHKVFTDTWNTNFSGHRELTRTSSFSIWEQSLP